MKIEENQDGMVKFIWTERKQKLEIFSPVFNYVSGEQPATGLLPSGIGAAKANLEWTTRE